MTRGLHSIGLVVLVFFVLLPSPAFSQGDRIVVGSKNFMENKLLAEIFAQLIEARTDLSVERRLGLAGTQVCFEALRTGAIDLYPEYTGTGLVSILQLPPTGDPRTALKTVRAEFLKRWDLWWLNPLGFDNSYALAIPRSRTAGAPLRTISDLAEIAPSLTAGFGYEFINRPDGLPGLQTRYGLTFPRVRAMQQSLKYQAAAAGEIDVLDVYTTDGRLAEYDFVVLEDDLHSFPPYEASGLIRGATLAQHPELGAALGLLTNAFDDKTMRQLNYRLQEGGEPLEVVARDALSALQLFVAEDAGTQPVSHQEGLFAYMWSKRTDLGGRTIEHLTLAGLALGLGILLAVPLGLLLERHQAIAEPVIRGIGLTQTISLHRVARLHDPGVRYRHAAGRHCLMDLFTVPDRQEYLFRSPRCRAPGRGLGSRARHDGMANPPLGTPAVGRARDHGRRTHRGGHHRRHDDAGRVHRRGRPGRADRRGITNGQHHRHPFRGVARRGPGVGNRRISRQSGNVDQTTRRLIPG